MFMFGNKRFFSSLNYASIIKSEVRYIYQTTVVQQILIQISRSTMLLIMVIKYSLIYLSIYIDPKLVTKYPDKEVTPVTFKSVTLKSSSKTRSCNLGKKQHCIFTLN